MKKTDQLSVRETVAIHLRAAKDVNGYAPGLFLSTTLLGIVTAISPYTTIWLSAQLINELASTRIPAVLAKWAMLVIAVTAGMNLLKAALERWHAAKKSLFAYQYHMLYGENKSRVSCLSESAKSIVRNFSP